MTLGTASAAYAIPEPAPGIVPFAVQTEPCDPNGATGADAALAIQLNDQLQSDMRGYMDAYRTSCARVVVQAVKARGLAERAAVIAIATVIVETHLQNRSDVVDHTSVGLFQQQDPWGSRENRLNPVWATNAFLNKMLQEYPNGTWQTEQIGTVAQRVQRSAYPDRYQVQAADAQRIVDALWTGGRPRADFDGDGFDDIGLYRQSEAHWHVKSVKRNAVLLSSHKYGSTVDDDIPLVGDFDGDGYSDIAVYRRNEGRWHVKSVRKDAVLLSSHPFGGWGSDIPLAGDFDGDGADDIVIYRAQTAEWTIWSAKRQTLLLSATKYGSTVDNDIPLVGDFDGDGYSDIAVYRKNEGRWHIKSVRKDAVLLSSHPFGGWGSDIPLAGDFDGDGADDIVIYRAQTAEWTIWSAKRQTLLLSATKYGSTVDNDIPQIGDFDGDNHDDIAVYRKNEGRWHIKSIEKNTVLYSNYPYGGNSSDIPINN
ncbi:FG-GAP-like repeat-containing protein [Micromonospora sp. C95]|uniref:FG-GAP-like repeat-containing protein n=2 Tax=Micromonospora sp. C95 TaxID=2824882 RepID=UPI001B391E4C|nr:FG-GAP-like repeat-containing protein [Micromonospora sp. C95]MBQ1028096.1 VCBS repeat-containing protein [Micromonospora sp. C95]